MNCQRPDPCQGCHYVTGLMLACIGVCEGLRNEEDVAIRAEAFAAIRTLHAETSQR